MEDIPPPVSCPIVLWVLLEYLYIFYIFLQDLLTSSLLSDDGHKAYHLPRRGMGSPLQVCISPYAYIYWCKY